MRFNVKVVALLWWAFILFAAATVAAQPPGPTGSISAQEVEAYGRLPLSFEPNQGQISPEVKFFARGRGYGLLLTSTEMVLALRQPAGSSPNAGSDAQEAVLRSQLVGANRRPEIVGEQELPGKSNYFSGRDPAKWHTNVPQFSAVRYRNVYRGIDLVYYGNRRQLEYDFVVAPGADPRQIRLRFTGTSSVKLNASGDLVLAVSHGTVTAQAPVLYQEADATKTPVAGRFVLKGKREVGFDIGPYDRTRTLIIDPSVVYSTYLGGTDVDDVFDAAVDVLGNVYLTGRTLSTNFPVTGGDIGYQAFIVKLNVNGGLAYSTMVDLGGSLGSFNSIAVDAQGYVYVAGYTQATDAPVVNAVQASCPTGFNGLCSTGFVLKLSPAGDNPIYATYLGGSDTNAGFSLRHIAADSDGSTYVAGSTNDDTLPMVNAERAFSGGYDVYMAKLGPQGAWAYATYLGGSMFDEVRGLAADAGGNAYVVGATDSPDFPTKNAVQATKEGSTGRDGFVTRLGPDGSIAYSTYRGGTGDDMFWSVVTNDQGTVWVTGASWPYPNNDFPISEGWPGPSDCSPSGPECRPGILVKLDADGRIVYSTATHIALASIAVDAAENVYLAGSASASAKPVNPLMEAGNIYVEKLDASAQNVLFSSFWGGAYHEVYSQGVCGNIGWTVAAARLTSVAVDGAGNIHLVGVTTQDDFPTLNALQPTPGGAPPLTPANSCEEFAEENHDVFVTKISPDDNTPTGTAVAVEPADGSSITFDQVTSAGTTSFARTTDISWWTIPDGFRLGQPPVHYEISTTATYTGSIEVCLDYSKVSFDVEAGLALFHYEGGAWTDITTSVDTTTNTVCGVTTSLSPFAIFGAPLPPVEVVGFAPPLAPLALEGTPLSWPDKAFKLGRTLPLKFQMLINGTPLTDNEMKAPTIVQIGRVDEAPLDLTTIDLDAGEANDHGSAFRYADGSWIYNLDTQGLSAGSYVITIQQPDGRRYSAGFVLRK